MYEYNGYAIQGGSDAEAECAEAGASSALMEKGELIEP
jgi:hypothetical protein